MKKTVAVFLAIVLGLFCITACNKNSNRSDEKIVIAIPNDPANKTRSLIFLEELGIIKLKEDHDETVDLLAIEENPYDIEIRETEASIIPSLLKSVDFAVINTNYALQAGIDPSEAALAFESEPFNYANIVAVKEGNETSDKTKALVAALESKRVADFIKNTYKDAVLSTVATPGDGYSASVDYSYLSGKTITVAASSAPHAKILAIAQKILAEKDITLEIKECKNYNETNRLVEEEEADANYFQHEIFLEEYNAANETNLIPAAAIHTEPLGIYGGKQTDLSVISNDK